MTDFYDEDFMKSVMSFDDVLDKNWLKKLDGLDDHHTISEMKWNIHNLQISLKVIYVVIKNEMKHTNKIYKILSKFPNEEKFQELKSLFEQRDNDIEETIKPLSNYAKELEESRKRNPDYIG